MPKGRDIVGQLGTWVPSMGLLCHGSFLDPCKRGNAFLVPPRLCWESQGGQLRNPGRADHLGAVVARCPPRWLGSTPLSCRDWAFNHIITTFGLSVYLKGAVLGG